MSTNAVSCSGTLTAGPQGVCEGSFPGGQLQVPFGIAGGGCGTKPAPRRFYTTTSVNSPVAFVALDGLGAGESVAQGNFLYLRSTVDLKLRLTTADPAGGADIVAVLPHAGLAIKEFPLTGYLKLLEVMGIGDLEYFASGNQ